MAYIAMVYIIMASFCRKKTPNETTPSAKPALVRASKARSMIGKAVSSECLHIDLQGQGAMVAEMHAYTHRHNSASVNLGAILVLTALPLQTILIIHVYAQAMRISKHMHSVDAVNINISFH